MRTFGACCGGGGGGGERTPCTPWLRAWLYEEVLAVDDTNIDSFLFPKENSLF